MKILRAPNDQTCTRITSVGEVKFVNGIATEFTQEQADYFTQRQRNYSVDDIVTVEETAEAKAAEVRTAEAKVAAEQKIIEEREAEEKVVAEKAAAERAAAEATAAATERAGAITLFLQTVDTASFGDVRAFAKKHGITAGGNKQAIVDRIKAAGPPDGEDKKPATDETPPAETASDEEPAAEITEEVNLNEADHPTLVEVAEQYGVKVEEAWSTEELRAALLDDEGIQNATNEVEEDEEEETPPDAHTEEIAKSGETTEAAQNAPDGAQAAPADASPDQGTGGLQGTRTVKLPTGKDNRAMVAQWCREHQVDDQGTKRELLEKIYADDRFKQ